MVIIIGCYNNFIQKFSLLSFLKTYDNYNTKISLDSIFPYMLRLVLWSLCYLFADIIQNQYYNEYQEGLVEIAKGFLNILLNQS